MKQTTLFGFLKPPAPSINKGGRPKKKKSNLPVETKEASANPDLQCKQTFLSKLVPPKIDEKKPGKCPHCN